MTCRVDMSLISQMCLKSQLSGSFHQSQSLALILGTFLFSQGKHVKQLNVMMEISYQHDTE